MRADKISFGQHIAKVQFNNVKDLTGTQERISGAKDSSMFLDGDIIQKDNTFCILDGDGKLKTAKFKGAYQESAAGQTVTQIMYQEHRPYSVVDGAFGLKKQSADIHQINSIEHPLAQLFSPLGMQVLAHKVSMAASALKEEVKLSNLFRPHY